MSRIVSKLPRAIHGSIYDENLRRSDCHRRGVAERIVDLGLAHGEEWVGLRRSR